MITEHVSIVICPLFVLFHSLFFSFIQRKVKDSLPLFRQFFSSAFSLTYVSLAAMKLPPDVLRWLTFCVPPTAPHLRLVITHFFAPCLHRALLTGLTSNPHINDLHLDISSCEVSRTVVHGIHLKDCVLIDVTRRELGLSQISIFSTSKTVVEEVCLNSVGKMRRTILMLDSGLCLCLCVCFFLSSAEICRSCCNPGTFPQSLIYRHAGYLRQRYVGTVLHLLTLWLYARDF